MYGEVGRGENQCKGSLKTVYKIVLQRIATFLQSNIVEMTTFSMSKFCNLEFLTSRLTNAAQNMFV